MALSPRKQRLVSEGPQQPQRPLPPGGNCWNFTFQCPTGQTLAFGDLSLCQIYPNSYLHSVLLRAAFRTRKAHLPPVMEAILSLALPSYPLETTKSEPRYPSNCLRSLRSLLSSPASDAKLLPRLGELTVADVTQDSVGLSWTVPEGEFDSFLVQYKDRGGQLQVVPVAADLREATIPSLEPNRKYKFLLFGLLGRKRLGPASVEGTTGEPGSCPRPPCTAPRPRASQGLIMSSV